MAHPQIVGVDQEQPRIGGIAQKLVGAAGMACGHLSSSIPCVDSLQKYAGCDAPPPTPQTCPVSSLKSNAVRRGTKIRPALRFCENANLTASGKQEFGAALQDVLRALEGDNSIEADVKEDIAGVVTQLGEETTKQKPNRMTFKSLLGGLLETINTIPSMVKAAEVLAPYIDKLPF
jgi:hypothetical protein